MSADVVMFYVDVMMMVSFVKCVLLVKLFYENNGNASAAVCEFCHIKSLQHGSMPTKGIWAMIKKLEETGKLGVQSGRGHKSVALVLVDAIKTTVATQSQASEFGRI